jgi:streptogramin lyase
METTRIKNRWNAILLGALVLGATASLVVVGAGGARQTNMAPGTANACDADSAAIVGWKTQNEAPLLDTFDRATALLGHGASKLAEDLTEGSPAPVPTTPTTTPTIVTFHVADKPQGIATGYVRGEEMVWVASLGTRSVLRLDARSGRVMALVPLEIAPLGLALGDGVLWITGGFNTVERLDLTTNRVVARIPVGMNPRIPVVSVDGVWIPNANDHTVSRIDQGTNRVVATIPVGDPLDCPASVEPLALTAGPGAVWVTQCGTQSVARIETSTNRVVATIRLGVEPTGLQLTGDTLWVTSQAYDRVLRIDTQSGRVLASITIAGPGAITATAGAVWVETSTGQLVRIDSLTNRVMNNVTIGAGVAAIPPSPVPSLPAVMMATGLGSLAASEGSVWASRAGSNVVMRIDPDPTQ